MLNNRVILVTGASRGIGRAMALDFALAGATVIATARTEGALFALDDEAQAQGAKPMFVVALDLRRADAIGTLFEHIGNRYGRLDGLVGNAAVLGALSPLDHYSAKDLGEIFEVNFMANFYLIQHGLKWLKQAEKARALFVTSGVSARPRAYWGGYAMSKAALDNMVLTLAEEVRHTEIRVNLLNPGATRTGMRAKAMPGEDPLSLPEPKLVAEFARPLMADACPHHGSVLSFHK